MNYQEDIDINQENAQLRYLQSQNQTLQSNQMQNEMYLQDQEKSMIKDQLDLSEEIEKINYLLRGYVYNSNTGNWDEPTNTEMIVLTDYGVHIIMNTIQWYINKNTLLSNYDDETIRAKMEDFATALTDVIFMEYEKVFKYPTFDDCAKEFKERIIHRAKLRQFNFTLKGIESDLDEIIEDILFEMRDRIMMEMDKIKEQIVKNKLKRFELIIREVQDSVHSTYLRAFNGQERRTLREHIHITESRGDNNLKQNQNSGGILSWFSGRRS